MERIEFTKMHGAGNDYIYINCLNREVANPEEMAVRLSARHFGVGSDGLVLILPSRKGDFRMRMFNADGSEAEMCGNAVRCVGKYLFDYRLTASKELTIETTAGLRRLKLFTDHQLVNRVEVNMGQPQWLKSPEGREIRNHRLSVDGRRLAVWGLSLGNPHCVLFSDELHRVREWGPLLEKHPLFPLGANIEFVRQVSEQELEIRVWERGSGETMACGTGACAAAFAAFNRGLTGPQVFCRLPGGVLEIRIEEENVFMTGGAEKVFEGVIEL